jgi:hypothetical protein
MRNICKSFSLVIILLLVFSSCSKKGCTDPMSLAYDVEAKKDDGGCTYPEVSKKTLLIRKTGDWCLVPALPRSLCLEWFGPG